MTEINKRILTSVALLLMLTVSFFNKYILTLVCIFIIYQILFEFNYMLKKIFIFKKKKNSLLYIFIHNNLCDFFNYILLVNFNK